MTPKIVEIELWFLYTTLLSNVTYLCMKFEVTNFNTYKVIPQTRFRDAGTEGCTDGRGDSSIPHFKQLHLFTQCFPKAFFFNMLK